MRISHKLGKKVNFNNGNSYEEIEILLADMNDSQKSKLKLLSDLIGKSDSYSHAMIDTVTSHEERKKYELIYF